MSRVVHPDQNKSAPSLLDRRIFLVGAAAAIAAGCTPTRSSFEPMGYAPAPKPMSAHPPHVLAMYGPMPNERFPVPAVDLSNVDPRYIRQRVAYDGSEEPGTIVVDPNDKFLYFIEHDGMAWRYGVGVGREGFGWSGRATVQRKEEWPTWTPPASMIQRQPELAKYASGQSGGLNNPLGARALYLFEGGRDTLYRIHGTNEPWSIGRAMSSGCVRLFNQDVIDLYDRAPRGTRVVVRSHGGTYGV